VPTAIVDYLLMDLIGNHNQVTLHRILAKTAISSYGSTAPVGLLGEFSTITRDLTVMSDVTSG